MTTQLTANHTHQPSHSHPAGHAWDCTGSPAARHQKILEIREQIAAGIYDSPEKLDAAADTLLSELSSPAMG